MTIYRSFKEFEKRMAIIAGNVITNSNKAKQRTALVIDGNLVLSTPVDTGRARSNWQVSNGSPSDELTPDNQISPGYVQGQKEEAIVSRALSGEPIFIANNLPYIGRLNEGYSAQAPAGFVETAILTGAQYAKTQKLLKP
jgi:hypothetical protein